MELLDGYPFRPSEKETAWAKRVTNGVDLKQSMFKYYGKSKIDKGEN